jgi:hypothetical protein
LTDVFIARFDGGLSHLWSSSYGTSGNDSGAAVASDVLGNVVIVGNGGAADFGGGPLGPGSGFVASFDASGAHRWSRIFCSTPGAFLAGVAVDGRGNVFAGGGFTMPGDFGSGLEPLYGMTDIVVASYDTNNNPRWSRTFGGTDDETVGAMAYEPARNLLYVAARFNGTVDFGFGPITSAGFEDAVLLRMAP